MCKACSASLTVPLNQTYEVPLMDIEDLNEIWSCHCSHMMNETIEYRPNEAYVRGMHLI
jgi:hypothetical protein